MSRSAIAVAIGFACVVAVVIAAVAALRHQGVDSTERPAGLSTAAASSALAAENADVSETSVRHDRTPSSGESSTRAGRGGRTNGSRRRVSRTPPIPPGTGTIPQAAQDQFRRAQGLFDEEKYAAARDGFQRVVEILGNGALSQAASELRSIAAEFASLSAALAPTELHIYTSADPGITEPVPLRQYLPERPPAGTPLDRLGVLEIVIDTGGAVESVHLSSPANRFRDKWWVSAAKTWRFRPAVKDGSPVRFLKRILITQPGLSDPQ